MVDITQDERYEALRAFRESLTPEQVAMLAAFMEPHAVPHSWACTAWGEGQRCCLSFIVPSVNAG